MDTTAKMELHLTGPNFAPDQLKVKELTSVLSAVETLFTQTVLQEYPHLKGQDIVLSLVDIEPGSLGLVFNSPLAEHGTSAFEKAARAIADQSYEYFSNTALESLRELASFTRRYQVTAEFRTTNGTRRTLATITPETAIEPFPKYSGETVIYGVVNRVGGKEPTVNLELPDGQSITCDIADTSLAIDLASHLYEMVGLKGLARWNARDNSLQEFKATELTRFAQGSIVEAFQSLSKLIGHYYADVDDVAAYVASLRAD